MLNRDAVIYPDAEQLAPPNVIHDKKKKKKREKRGEKTEDREVYRSF
jgi:hypothetical protein